MQASAILLNLHQVVLSEARLPEEWFVNADNTLKETKNNFHDWISHLASMRSGENELVVDRYTVPARRPYT